MDHGAWMPSIELAYRKTKSKSCSRSRSNAARYSGTAISAKGIGLRRFAHLSAAVVRAKVRRMCDNSHDLGPADGGCHGQRGLGSLILATSGKERHDSLAPGTVLRDYTIESVIGHGGFGIVYRARHDELGLVVAIKEYLPIEIAVRQGATVRARSDAGQSGL